MLVRLQDFFTRFLVPQKDISVPRADAVALATVVLLIEVSLADGQWQDEEQEMIETIAATSFDLDAQQVRALIAAAQQEADAAVSLYDFTRLLNTHLSRQERAAVVEQLWRLAYADQLLDKYEEYSIRKIADLLYVSHTDYIKAKHAAQR